MRAAAAVRSDAWRVPAWGRRGRRLRQEPVIRRRERRQTRRHGWRDGRHSRWQYSALHVQHANFAAPAAYPDGALDAAAILCGEGLEPAGRAERCTHL